MIFSVIVLNRCFKLMEQQYVLFKWKREALCSDCKCSVNQNDHPFILAAYCSTGAFPAWKRLGGVFVHGVVLGVVTVRILGEKKSTI